MIRLLFDRKRDSEVHTIPGIFCPYFTPVFRYQGVADGESQPGSLSGILGGKEGIKKLVQVLLCNGWTGIGKGEYRVVTYYRGRNGDGFGSGKLHIYSKYCIVKDIHNYLGHLLGENRDLPLQPVIFDDLNIIGDF